MRFNWRIRRTGSEVRRDGRSGHAAVEVALMAPWIFLLFMVVLDLGMYSYAAIATQNAARSGAMEYSKTSLDFIDPLTLPNMSNAVGCTISVRELQGMPNVGPSTPCTGTVSVSDGAPIVVAARAIVGADSVGGAYNAVQVAVTYQTPQLIPLPGLLGRMTLTRIAEARFRGN